MPFLLMSMTAASKIQSEVGSTMCSINSLTESVGASDESSDGAAGVAAVVVAEVGLDVQYCEVSALTNSTAAQPIIHPRLICESSQSHYRAPSTEMRVPAPAGSSHSDTSTANGIPHTRARSARRPRTLSAHPSRRSPAAQRPPPR